MIKPAKLERIIATKVMKIEGMRCENCNRRVQNALNQLDGVNAKVYGDRAEAVVKLGRDIEDIELEKAVSGLGYRVIRIEKI